MSDIVLGAGQQSAVLFLQQIREQSDAAQERLDTGRKVNSAVDDPVAFFRSQTLLDHAADLLTRKATIDQSIQTVQTALDATSAVGGLLQQLQGVLQGARSGSPGQRTAATRQFTELGRQLAQLLRDASYQGLNILTSTAVSLATQFSARTAATLVVRGYDLTATAASGNRALFTQAAAFTPDGTLVFSALVGDAGLSAQATGFSQLDLLGGTAAGGAFPASTTSNIFAASADRIDRAISQLRAVSGALGITVAVLQTRASFSAVDAATLQNASNALTLADLNEEAANSQALALRQQLGIGALAGAGKGSQAILTLLR